MVEVFKTNIEAPGEAGILVRLIEKEFKDHSAHFDLEDCDRILRVESSGPVKCSEIMELFHYLGFHIDILPDEPFSDALSVKQTNEIS